MNRTTRVIVIAGVVVLVLSAAVGLVLYRAGEVEAASYEQQAARWWALGVGGYNDFADQVMSLRVEPASVAAVCHNAKVQLQNLNSISLAGQVPERYQAFHQQFMEAVSANRLYYRRILQLCSEGIEADGDLLSGLHALGKDVEDSYREAHALLPDIGASVEQGTYSEANEQLSRIFRAKPPQAAQPQPARPRVVEVPRTGYSPSFPPAVGSIVVVETPRRVGVNLRVEPSLNAPRVDGRELVESGERVLVLDRTGYWLFVQTEDGYYGYIRWWYEDTPYVRP